MYKIKEIVDIQNNVSDVLPCSTKACNWTMWSHLGFNFQWNFYQSNDVKAPGRETIEW